MKYIFFILFFSSLLIVKAEEINIKISYVGNMEFNDKISYKYGDIIGKIDNNSIIKININKDTKLYLFNTKIGNFSFDYDDLKNNTQLILHDKEYNAGPITVFGIKENSTITNSTSLNSDDRLQYDGGMFLDNIVGFSSIKKSPSYGFDPVLRGFKNEQINILVNGCESSINSCPNRMDPPTSHIPMSQIEKVEVIKGPYGLRYGNSFGGVVNFIPIDEFAIDYDNVVKGNLSSNYESNGSITKNNLNLIYGDDKAFVGLSASFNEGGNYNDGSDSTVQAKFQKSGLGVNTGFKFDDNTIKAKFSMNSGKDVDYPTLGMDMKYDDTYSVEAEHSYNFNSNNLQSLKTNIYYSKVEHLMSNYLRPSAKMMLHESLINTINYGGRTEAEFNFNNSQLYTGIDFKSEFAEGDSYQNSSIQKSSLFSQYSYHQEDYNIMAAFRLEYNQPTSEMPDSNFYKVNAKADNQVNFSASIGSNYYIINNFTIGLWLGRSQRSGSISERYINYFPIGLDPYEVVGNPNVKQEVNNQLDLQINFNSEVLDFKINPFFNLINNYILAIKDNSLIPKRPTSPGVRRISNYGDAYKYGVELSISNAIVYDIRSNINLAYTYAEMQNNEPMPEIMPLEVNIKLYRKFLDDKLKTEVELHYAGNQDRVSTTFSEKTTPDYYVLNANLSYQIFGNLSVELGVNNILDQAYYQHLSRTISGTNRRLYSPGRSMWATLSVSI